MAFGLSAGAVALIGAGGAVAGGMIAANGAKSAANTQAEATGKATQLAKDQWQQTLANTTSYRGAGDAATYKLAQLLGISPQSVSAGTQGGAQAVSQGLSADQIRAELLPQFTSGSASSIPLDDAGTSGNASTATVNEQGLQAAIAERMAAQAAAQSPQGGQPTQPGQSGYGVDPTAADYGSLLKNPYTGPFTAADYLANKDPGYEFMRMQGQQALQNSQAANGGVLSGAALKGLMSYNQDYANTGYGAAYSRYNDSFNRVNTQQNAIYNRLSNLAGVGANAAVGVGNTGAQLANSAMGSTIAGGNAQAQGTIGVGNAINSGINNATGYYQLNSILNRNTPNSTSGVDWRTTGDGMPPGYQSEGG